MVRYLSWFAMLMSLHTIVCIFAWLWPALYIYSEGVKVLIVGFGYDISVMISWLFSCPKQLNLKITLFIVYLVRFDCEFQI